MLNEPTIAVGGHVRHPQAFTATDLATINQQVRPDRQAYLEDVGHLPNPSPAEGVIVGALFDIVEEDDGVPTVTFTYGEGQIRRVLFASVFSGALIITEPDGSFSLLLSGFNRDRLERLTRIDADPPY